MTTWGSAARNAGTVAATRPASQSHELSRSCARRYRLPRSFASTPRLRDKPARAMDVTSRSRGIGTDIAVKLLLDERAGPTHDVLLSNSR